MQANKRSISRNDCLWLDEAATEKHEFYRGQMFAMAGGADIPSTSSYDRGDKFMHYQLVIMY